MTATAKGRHLVVLSVLTLCPFAGPAAVPHFEVVSVKPCAPRAEPLPGDRRGDARQSSPDRLHLTCQTLMNLIQWAYVNYEDARFNPLASVPISGGPAWINTEEFQI